MYLMCTCGSSSIVNYAGCATIYTQTLQHHLVYSVFVPFIFIRLSRFYCFLLYFFLHCRFFISFKPFNFFVSSYFMAQFYVQCRNYIFMCAEKNRLAYEIASHSPKSFHFVCIHFMYVIEIFSIVSLFLLWCKKVNTLKL